MRNAHIEIAHFTFNFAELIKFSLFEILRTSKYNKSTKNVGMNAKTGNEIVKGNFFIIFQMQN